LKNYVKKVARPDTKVDVHGVAKYSPKMPDSDYMQFLHLPQVIENALQAEREGYDAFCIGGTLDLGHIYLREILDRIYELAKSTEWITWGDNVAHKINVLESVRKKEAAQINAKKIIG